MIAPLVDMVQAISLFSDCGKGFIEVLGKKLKQQIWPTGEAIIKEGTEGDDMFVLMLGKCRVIRGTQQEVVGHLRSGNAFGLHALLNITKTRTANVLADTVCDTRSLNRAGLLSALSLYPEEEAHIRELVDAHGQNHKAATLALMQASEKEGGFSKSFTKVLADNMHDIPFLTKQVIIEQGAAGKVFVVLVHGIVDIEVDGIKVATIAAPAIFGEQSLLVPGSTSTATVRAATVTECMSLPTDADATREFRDIFVEDFEKMHVILQKKLSRNTQTLANLNKDSTIVDSQANASFFKDCSPEFMTEISSCLQKVVYMEGQMLFVEGEDTHHGIIIHQGWAGVEVKGEQVGRLGPGEFIGEFVILGKALKATATVRAEERLVAFTIDQNSFRELLHVFPEERIRLENVMKQRVEAKTRRHLATEERQLIVNSRAVSKFLSVRQSVKAQEQAPKPKKPPLLGYVKARKWLRQRKAAVAEAPSIRWQRMVARGDIAEPLPPDQGLRVTKNGVGTPWRHLPPQDAFASAMRARKVDDVYGRKVWQESFNAISNRVVLSPVVALQGDEEEAAGGMPPGVIEDTAQELEAALNDLPETTAPTAAAEDFPATLLPTVWKKASDQGQSAQPEPRSTALAPHLPEQALQHGRQSLGVSEDPTTMPVFERHMSSEEKRSRKSLSERIQRISLVQMNWSREQADEKERAAEEALERKSRQSMIQLAELLQEPETDGLERTSEHGSESASPTNAASPRQEASSPRQEPPKSEAPQEQSDALQETSEPGGRSSRGLESVDLEHDYLWQPEHMHQRVEALVQDVVWDALPASPEVGEPASRGFSSHL